MLNLYYQTTYRPEDLEEWADADVQEAVALAKIGLKEQQRATHVHDSRHSEPEE